MQGYLNRPEATAEAIVDGWFYTGDIGYVDEDGFVFIVDRKKDMIIKGGYNIYPREIEEVLYQLPQVAEAAVVGVVDDAKGEQVRAVISVAPGRRRSTRDKVETHLAREPGQVQAAERVRVHGRAAQGPDGQDPQARAARGPAPETAAIDRGCTAAGSNHVTSRISSCRRIARRCNPSRCRNSR